MEYQYILTMGLNDKDTKTQLHKLQYYTNKMKKLLQENFSGYTLTTADGGYTHENTNIFTSEKSLRVELSFTTEQKVKNFCKTLKDIFNQEYIIFDKRPLTSILI